LFLADEMLGPILLTAHNLTYYQRLMAGARAAIEENRYVAFMQEKIRAWAAAEAEGEVGR
jgi:queuine tRNA-ribosyltransferase